MVSSPFGGFVEGMAPMARMKHGRLSGIETLADFRMRLIFVSGEVYTLDFQPLLAQSPGLAPLREFARAALIEGEGWAVQ